MKESSVGAYFLGEAIGAAMCGVPLNRIEFEKAAADAMDEERGEPFHRQAARLAKLAYEAVGRQRCFGYHLYARLHKCAAWEPAYARLMSPFYVALVNTPIEPAGHTKAAMLTSALNMIPTAANVGTSALKQLMLASLVTGSGLGALHWGINRHVREDENKNEALKTKVDFYDRLTRELENELGRRSINPGAPA